MQIRQGKSAGGVLSGIFYHSMSLQEAVKRGRMPPLTVFNDFMACGIDDIDTPCIHVDRMSTEGAVLEWIPFKLTPGEYRSFLRHLRKSGEHFRIVDYSTSSFKVWFEECFRFSASERSAVRRKASRSGSRPPKRRGRKKRRRGV
jgi:hypothetical protein